MADGDEDAFTLLYRRRQGGIYRFALQITGNAGISEEVTQETFLTLIRQPHKFDPSRGSLAAFLFGVARKLILRNMGQERAHLGQNVPDDDDSIRSHHGPATASPDPGGEFERSQRVEQVRRAVLVLPAIYREVVVLCELEEMTYEEAAAVLGCAIGTVRSRLHRGRTLLAEKLSALLTAKAGVKAGHA